MSAPGRWLRLDAGWAESEWLVGLSGLSQLAWVRLLCYTKTYGVGGSVKALGSRAAEKLWNVPPDDFAAMLEAGQANGAIVVEGSEWVVPKWRQYQEVDSTNRLRQRAFREKKRTGKKWSAGLECQTCGSKKDLTRDHIVPHSQGGTDKPENIRVLCRRCNSSRQGNVEWDDEPNALPADITRYTGVTRRVTETETETDTTSKATSLRAGARRKSHAHRLPDDWALTDRHREKAQELGLDVDDEAEGFKLHHQAKGSRFVRWDLAFHSWLRNAKKFQRNGRPDPSTQLREHAASVAKYLDSL